MMATEAPKMKMTTVELNEEQVKAIVVEHYVREGYAGPQVTGRWVSTNKDDGSPISYDAWSPTMHHVLTVKAEVTEGVLRFIKSSEDAYLHCPVCLKKLEYSEIGDDYDLTNEDGAICDAPITNITCGKCGFTINVNLEF